MCPQMNIIDRGQGTPVVLIPGIQGRWEWMRPAVDALAARLRVITFSLADEPTAEAAFDPATGFERYVAQVATALDLVGLERATICGVSYGGLVAAAFATRHTERVSGLALVSSLPPHWIPDERVRRYLRAPRLYTPLFCLASVRLYTEIAAAAPNTAAGLWTALAHLGRVAAHPFAPTRMAHRVLAAGTVDWSGVGDVHVPTLLVTGEAGLDRVVPPALTRAWSGVWPHARHVTLERTGHLGFVTRADAFADVIAGFARDATCSTPSSDAWRQVG
jgi:pimeloyl-ACP methyl ester carboxylesterase